MRLETATFDLLAALSAVKPASPGRSTHAILERKVLWEQGPDGSMLYATNLELAIGHNLSGAFEGAGRCVFALPSALAFLKACEGESVTLSCNPEGGVTFTTGADESLTLETEDPDEYPIRMVFGPDENTARVPIGAVELRGMLGEVLPSIKKEPGRYAMHCGRVELVSGEPVRIVGADGHRLTVSTALEAPAVGVLPDPFPDGVLFPRFLLDAVRKALPKKGDALAWIHAGDTYSPTAETVGVAIGATTYYAKAETLVEFPRYSNPGIMRPPAAADSIATVDPVEACKRLKLAATACDPEAPKVRMDLGDATVSVTSEGGTGSASATIKASLAVRGKKGPAFKWNPGYAIDALSASQERTKGEVTIRWDDPGRPIMLDAPGYVAVVMPISN